MRRRRLGRELRRHREAAGRTHVQVAEALGCSDAKVSYMESGRYKIQWRDVRDMLDFCGVDDPAVVEPLIDMAKQSAQKSWWISFRDTVPNWFETFIALETEAATVLHYEQMAVPGLLQTEEYATAITSAGFMVAPEERAAVVALRMERQRQLVADPPMELRVVLEEAALRRPVGGPTVHRAQLGHLLKVVTMPNVTLQVLPTALGAHAGLHGPITLFTFEADPTVVYLEHHEAAAYLEDPAVTREYLRAFDRLRADALSQKASVELIDGIAEG